MFGQEDGDMLIVGASISMLSEKLAEAEKRMATLEAALVRAAHLSAELLIPVAVTGP